MLPSCHVSLCPKRNTNIYSKEPRLTVEVVIIAANQGGVLLSRRQTGPCRGLWHIPGGTVRFGERLTEAACRVPRGELGLVVDVGPMIGYIEPFYLFARGQLCHCPQCSPGGLDGGGTLAAIVGT
jgi:8-oxo-dGTP pyrophosphatase MutT (NUDIX family)